MLNRVREGNRQMNEIIDSLLKFSRLNRQPVKRQGIDMKIMAKEEMEKLREHEPDQKVEFTLADLPPIHADPSLVRQIWTNLLSNALKYSRKRETSQVEVGFQAGEHETTYFVRDNGAGFDMTYMDKLFAPFQRLHTIDEYPGTGIGLATVRRIIHRHGGKVWAEGQTGKGATFYFSIHE